MSGTGLLDQSGAYVQCIRCHANYGIRSGFYSCPSCNGILDVRYGTNMSGDAAKEIFSRSTSEQGVWRFFDLLPIASKESIVSLHEGNTPLIKAFTLGANLYLKDESRNPTCSFKDRPNTVGISKAVELKAKRIAIASSGNAAGSLTAYAAKAGIECVVAVPEDIPTVKLGQIMIFGARVVRIKGTYSDAFNVITESCRKFGWHNLSSVCTANPYQVEGDKTVAYEIFEQLGRTTPDWVAVPLGAGPLLVGLHKGFKELQKFGLIEDIPKLIGVQASGCAPIVRAFKNGDKEVVAWDKPETIAHSIADPLAGYTQDGTLTLSKIRESNGVAESVSDLEMVEAVKTIAESEGIYAEHAAASPIAAVWKLQNAGVIKKEDVVVSIITGTGLKSSEGYRDLRPIQAIDPDAGLLYEVLK